MDNDTNFETNAWPVLQPKVRTALQAEGQPEIVSALKKRLLRADLPPS